MSVIKEMNELFSEEGLTPKQYVDVARIKASRVQRNKDYALTKAEKAVLSEINRDLTKYKERMEKFGPQHNVVVTEPEEKKEVSIPTTKVTKPRRKPNVKRTKSEV